MENFVMTYNLFIDDERVPMDVKWGTPGEQYMYLTYEWVIARNWVEVLELVVTFGFPQMISFDHDLGENEKTGYEIARKLCDMIMDGLQLPDDFEFKVHSKNPVGAENIRVYMNNFLKHYGE
jgi:hypothetical protein